MCCIGGVGCHRMRQYAVGQVWQMEVVRFGGAPMAGMAMS